MHIINISSLCTFMGQPCCPVLSQLQSFFVEPYHMTEQSSRCDKTRACRTCLVDGAVKKVEQRFIINRLLLILAANVVSICFDSFTIQGYSKQFSHLNLLNFHMIYYKI